uniref:Uncharacterized protein n=1 Tax=Cyprinus carpio carpio TaxID=630221 RepID=A0A9J7XLE0_CYPCA
MVDPKVQGTTRDQAVQVATRPPGFEERLTPVSSSCGLYDDVQPSCAVVLGWRPSCAVVLGWRPSCAVALGWRPSCAVALGWRPSCAVALGWRPSCAVASNSKMSQWPSWTVALGWRPSCLVALALAVASWAVAPPWRTCASSPLSVRHGETVALIHPTRVPDRRGAMVESDSEPPLDHSLLCDLPWSHEK